jgi:nicotinamidase-related amidase
MPFSPQHNALLCLNLQSDYINESNALFVENAEDIVGEIKRVLAYARRAGWPIVHMQSRAPNLFCARGNPIAGLEPRASEPVLFKKRYSALRHEELIRFLREARVDTTYAVGFSLATDCVATAYDSVEFGIPIAYVERAIGTPPMAEFSSQTLTRVMNAVLSPLIEFVDLDTMFRAPAQFALTSQEPQ